MPVYFGLFSSLIFLEINSIGKFQTKGGLKLSRLTLLSKFLVLLIKIESSSESEPEPVKQPTYKKRLQFLKTSNTQVAETLSTPVKKSKRLPGL